MDYSMVKLEMRQNRKENASWHFLKVETRCSEKKTKLYISMKSNHLCMPSLLVS